MFQTILLAVFGSVAVAGVLIFAFAVGSGGSNTVGAIRIWGTLDQGAFTAVLKQAAENDTRLAQVTYEQKDEATYMSDIVNALASGKGPDLFLIRQDYAMSQAARIIPVPYESLSASQFQSAFVEGASPFLAENGVLGIPLSVDPLVLYWNKDILSTAGYAKPPQYWDELYDMAQKITQRNELGEIQRSAVAFGEYKNIGNAKLILSTLIMQAGGTITSRDSTGHIVPALMPRTGTTNQATVSALRYYTEFADPSKNDYSWNRALPDAQKSFAAGDVALYVGLASEQPLISRMNPNLNYAVSAIPQIRGSKASIDGGYVYALAAARTGTNPTGAVTAAFTIASTETSKALSVALGIPSARRDVLSQPIQGDDEIFNKQAIIVRSWIDPDPQKTENIFRGMIEDTTSGAALLTEAVQRADQELGHILEI